MADYISTTELNHFLLGQADVPSLKKDLIITSASRYFDRLCQVESDFFQVAVNSATNKVINGNGLGLLPLPPFAGSLGNVSADNVIVNSDYYKVTGNTPNQYLCYRNLYTGIALGISLDLRWQSDKPYTISARWGFEAIPNEVKMSVIEIAIALCSGLDIARAMTLDENQSSPLLRPDGIAMKTAMFYRERLQPIGI